MHFLKDFSSFEEKLCKSACACGSAEFLLRKDCGLLAVLIFTITYLLDKTIELQIYVNL